MCPVSNDKFYSISNKQDIANKIVFSTDDINPYYRVMFRIFVLYNESLFYFSRGNLNKNYMNNLLILSRCIDIYRNNGNFREILRIVDNKKYDEVNDKKKRLILQKEIENIKYRNNASKILEFVNNKRDIDNLSKETLDKTEFMKVLGNEENRDFKKFYQEYEKLSKFILEIYDKNKIDKILTKVLHKLNENIVRETLNKNYGDRADYYLTFTDMQIYEYFISPVVSFHGILVSLVFPPAGVTVASTLITTATVTGIGIAKDQLINTLKRVYNIGIRSNAYYHIDNEKFNKNMSLATGNSEFDISNSIYKNIDHKLDFDLYKLKDVLKQLEQITSRNGDFNYYVSNSFKYYVKFRINQQKLYNDFIAGREFFSNLNSNDIAYNNAINKNKDIYYKAMSYYRNKNTVEQTLKVQAESMKFISKSLLIMLRGNSDFKIFLKHFNNKYDYNNNLKNYYKKISEIASTKIGSINKANLFLDFIITSLNDSSPNHLSELELKKLFNESSKINPNNPLYSDISKNETFKESAINNLNNIGGNELFVRQAVQVINTSKVTDVFMKYSDIYDWGLWSSLGLLDGILYLSNSSSVKNKFKKVSSILTKISGIYKSGNYVLGAVNLTANILDKLKVLETSGTIFSNSIFSSFTANPFSLITTVLGVKLSSSVKSNYEGTWTEISEKYEEFKDKQLDHNKFPRSTAFEFFINYRKSDPIEVIHKISDIYKDKLSNIVSLSKAINEKMIQLHEKVNLYNFDNNLITIDKRINEKKSFASYFKFNMTPEKIEEEIIADYIKILLSILSLAKEVQLYEYYLDFLKDLDLEINNYLKLNSLILINEHKVIFSVLNFAFDSKINRDIFEDI